MGRPPKTDLSVDLRRVLQTIGQNILSLRIEKQLSQSALAEKAQISATTLNEIESRGHRDIRLSTLSSIAKALGVSVLELFVESDINLSAKDRVHFLQASEAIQKIAKKLKDDT